MNSSTVLVTGGAGFIGSHVVDHLLRAGHQMVVVDNLSTGDKNNLPSSERIKFYQGSIEKDDLETIFTTEKPEFVIHLAAQTSVVSSIEHPIFDAQVNILGTIRILELSRKYHIKRFIAASSAAVYGDPQYLPVDENHPTKPLSPYGLSKLGMEKYIQHSGVPYIIFRFSNVYGPRQKSSKESGVIAIFDDAMKKQAPLTIYGDGKQVRDFIYVEDVARTILQGMNSDIANEIINISTGKGTELSELFSLMKDIYEYPQQPLFKEARAADIKLSVLSNQKIKEMVKAINFTPLSDGLKRLCFDGVKR